MVGLQIIGMTKFFSAAVAGTIASSPDVLNSMKANPAFFILLLQSLGNNSTDFIPSERKEPCCKIITKVHQTKHPKSGGFIEPCLPICATQVSSVMW